MARERHGGGSHMHRHVRSWLRTSRPSSIGRPEWGRSGSSGVEHEAPRCQAQTYTTTDAEGSFVSTLRPGKGNSWLPAAVSRDTVTQDGCPQRTAEGRPLAACAACLTLSCLYCSSIHRATGASSTGDGSPSVPEVSHGRRRVGWCAWQEALCTWVTSVTYLATPALQRHLPRSGWAGMNDYRR